MENRRNHWEVCPAIDGQPRMPVRRNRYGGWGSLNTHLGAQALQLDRPLLKLHHDVTDVTDPRKIGFESVSSGLISGKVFQVSDSTEVGLRDQRCTRRLWVCRPRVSRANYLGRSRAQAAR